MSQTRFDKRFPSAIPYQLNQEELKDRKRQITFSITGAILVLVGLVAAIALSVNPWIARGIFLLVLFAVALVNSKTPGGSKVLVRGPRLQWYQVRSAEDIKRAANLAALQHLVIAFPPFLSLVIFPPHSVHGYDIFLFVGFIVLMSVVGIKHRSQVLKHLPQGD
jgi:hypothetical protein